MRLRSRLELERQRAVRQEARRIVAALNADARRTPTSVGRLLGLNRDRVRSAELGAASKILAVALAIGWAPPEKAPEKIPKIPHHD